MFAHYFRKGNCHLPPWMGIFLTAESGDPTGKNIDKLWGGAVDRRWGNNGPSSKMMLMRSRNSGSFFLSSFLEWGHKEFLSLQGYRLIGTSTASTDNGVILPAACQSSKESWQTIKNSCHTWKNTSIILGFRRQKQEDLCKFKSSLVYLVSCRPAKMTEKLQDLDFWWVGTEIMVVLHSTPV